MTVDDTTLGAVVLGIDGFALVGVELAGGEVRLVAETTAVRVGCSECGVIATPHDRRTTEVRDLPVAGRPARLVWRKRVWRCDEPRCPRRTWTEQRDDVVRSRRCLTERVRAEVCRKVAAGASVAEVAREFGIGWQTAMYAVVDHGTPKVDDPDRTAEVRALGVDETSFLRAGRKRRTQFVTGLVDLRRGRLLDVVEGRAGSAVSDWLADRDQAWLSAVERVALDPYRGYYNALVGGLPAPEVVVDCFHIIRLGNTMVDDVRRRVQQDTLGHRGRKGDPLYGIRRLLLTGEERLTDHGRKRLAAGLAAGDPDEEVWYAHVIKEQLRAVYRAGNIDAAREALADFYDVAKAADIPEATRLATTIRRWEDEVLAYYSSDGLSNGRTEAINALMKKIKRIGHGFRNFDNYRLRLLLACGGITWQHQPTARIRGRSPRLAV